MLTREWHFSVLAAALYFAMGLAKMRAYMLAGRFWAEEGGTLFVPMSALPFLDRTVFLYAGHLLLPTNLVVALSAEVPFALAPLVTTHLSFLLQSIPVLMLIALRRELGLERWALLAVLVVIVGLPQSAEVWANSTNLHSHFALAAALVALVEHGEGLRKQAFRGVLLVAGLSGLSANLLAPIFLALAVSSRDRERWVQFGILAATCALQLALLVCTDSSSVPRSITLDPRLYWVATLSQQVLSPLFGIEVGDRLAEILKRVLANDPQAILFALACSLPLVVFARAAISGSADGVRVTFAAAALLTLFGIAGALGEKHWLVTANVGGRYFFASNVLVAIFLFRLACTQRDLLLRAVLTLLFASSALGVPYYVGGPPWRLEYEEAVRTNAAILRIWPVPMRMPNPLHR